MDCRIKSGNDERACHLRPYAPADEDAAIALWLVTWQATYPQFDFAGRLDWWRAHWRRLAQAAKIVVAADAGEAMIGFVTIEPHTHYLDQLVVAPDHWGKAVAAALMTEAKRLCADFIDLDVNTDNARALGFYKKQGFVVTGNGINEFSGRPIFHMRWRAGA
ncbi:MAG TPA: GNAT family N-acetyltransferase [Xanthobacteraceae bacterium]|nr:GNAT family N-acetyltransferase [Xanthobacteraceae bacterium]